MPTYEYLCTSCGHEWEFEQSIKDEPQKVCEKCNEHTARRQISRGVGFILKGSGWYADLYSSSSNKEPAKETAAKSESSSESKASSSGDSKPASSDSSSGSTPTSSGTSTAAA